MCLVDERAKNLYVCGRGGTKHKNAWLVKWSWYFGFLPTHLSFRREERLAGEHARTAWLHVGRGRRRERGTGGREGEKGGWMESVVGVWREVVELDDEEEVS